MQRPFKRLHLQKETLKNLRSNDLAAVAGASGFSCPGQTCQTCDAGCSVDPSCTTTAGTCPVSGDLC